MYISPTYPSSEKLRRGLALAVSAIVAFLSLTARAYTYPETSYRIEGKKLMEWTGPERVVDFSDDPALARITSIADFAFAGTGVEEVALPSGVRIVPIGAFEGCMSLSKVDLGPRTAFIREGAFAGCKSLNAISIPDGMLYIGPAAFEGSGLRSIDLSATSVFEYGDRAFADCPILKKVSLGETAPLNLGSDIFRGCTAIDSISVPAAWTQVPRGMFADATALRTAIIGGDVTAIADSAFTGCTSLRRLDIGASVTTIGEDAFAGDVSLRIVSFPETLRSIGDRAFADCSGLRRLFFGRSLSSIGANAFAGCHDLEQIDISAPVPPQSLFGSFAGVDRPYVALAVPGEAEDAYYSAPEWQEFNVQPLSLVADIIADPKGRTVLYSLEGRRLEVPDATDAASPATLTGLVPPGFYILVRPGETPRKVLVR